MYKFSSLAIALLLVGCGGGGGDSSSGNIRVFSRQPTVDIVGHTMLPLTAHIEFDSKGSDITADLCGC
ncbi:hypothetical protein P4S64_09105 [Vibrio sp. M60_M31a]